MADVWLPLIGGLVLLFAGGDLLVRGSVLAATRLGISPLVIGLTLVGFGTSTPELVTSVQAALAGAPGIAYGNIVGSNIANILLIGGVAALLCPIVVSTNALRRDGAVMTFAIVVFAALAATVILGRIVGGCFLATLAIYLIWTFRQERRRGATEGDAPEPASPSRTSLPAALGIAAAGLVLVIFGGRFLVDGAVALALGFGISETVIGLTIVAVGTSMPELVTSVVAGFRRQSEMAFGNIVGSNIYNVLGIGGVTALVAPTRVPAEIVSFDNLVMIGVCILFMLFSYTGLRMARWEGAALLTGYCLYVFAIWP
ncbi:calcium/sodium antiporter [Minwuia sp.]|uniref:calcium/sodium antiporter n=1 Tax=Minwuia sp. TaxID=2493630 RepID=UPI003A92626F